MNQSHEGYPVASTIEVLPGEWHKLSKEGALHTSHVSTCIAVAIYSPSQKEAYLGHFQHVDFEHEGSFYSMMLHALKNLASASEVKVWLGGGEILNPDFATGVLGHDQHAVEVANAETQAFRERAVGVCEVLGAQGAIITTTWLDNTPAHLDYSLDVSSGIQTITITS